MCIQIQSIVVRVIPCWWKYSNLICFINFWSKYSYTRFYKPFTFFTFLFCPFFILRSFSFFWHKFLLGFAINFITFYFLFFSSFLHSLLQLLLKLVLLPPFY